MIETPVNCHQFVSEREVFKCCQTTFLYISLYISPFYVIMMYGVSISYVNIKDALYRRRFQLKYFCKERFYVDF